MGVRVRVLDKWAEKKPTSYHYNATPDIKNQVSISVLNYPAEVFFNKKQMYIEINNEYQYTQITFILKYVFLLNKTLITLRIINVKKFNIKHFIVE